MHADLEANLFGAGPLVGVAHRVFVHISNPLLMWLSFLGANTGLGVPQAPWTCFGRALSVDNLSLKEQGKDWAGSQSRGSVSELRVGVQGLKSEGSQV